MIAGLTLEIWKQVDGICDTYCFHSKEIVLSGNFFSVPLVALLGLPFYVNTEASMPMVRAFIDSGMSEGSALAFLITGAGTLIGALAGALTIARWRVISIVLAVLVIGAIVFGGLYNLIAPFYF